EEAADEEATGEDTAEQEPNTADAEEISETEGTESAENLNAENTEAEEIAAKAAEPDNFDDSTTAGFEIAEVTEASDNIDDLADDNAADDSAQTDDNAAESTQSAESADVDGDVFDDYEITNEKESYDKISAQKDYGSYFDEDKDADVSILKAAAEANDISELNDDVTDYNPFSDEDDEDEKEVESSDPDSGKKKKNTVITVVCILVILAAIGFIAFCIINGSSKDAETGTTAQQTSSTQAVTESTAQTEATQESTEEATTKAAENKTVISVVGYGYSYAKSLLEDEGFTVEIGEYRYSSDYDEGYVISQTPSGNSNAEKGSVVTLDISLGKEAVETTTAAPTQAATQATSKSASSSASSSAATAATTAAATSGAEKTDSSYIFSDSASAYLSSSDVEALSKEDLSLALNEIYARRGRIFNDSTLAAYFNSKTWYTPKYTAEEFSENVTFNKYEQANLQLLVDEQKSRGYR
ncbi:MAG: YARHG domain-containing protein, partial [Clostridiales bacterium]|nr:YARHG domain-containing protein [Clostridiales bacterium]